MRWCCCWVVCLAGCGLTLDLEERPDGSARDVSGSDGEPDLDVGVDARRDAASDAAMSDAADGAVEPADGGADSSLDECVPECGFDQVCSGGGCIPRCGDAVCFEGQMCEADTTCVPECSGCALGQRCGPDGRCICAEGECASNEQCNSLGECTVVECNSSLECVDPAGAGCTEFDCVDFTCVGTPVAVSSDCGFCDPRTGEVRGYDLDGDGFEACPLPGCSTIEDCDCDDTNPFINPDAVDLLSNRNCDDSFEPVPFFCLVDGDEDRAPVIQRARLGICERGLLRTVSQLLNALPSLRRLDCDDSNDNVFPQQTEFMGVAIGEVPCTAGRGQCFDYNCDGRHEREHPAFVRCRQARTEEECAASGGWRRDNTTDAVPACGETGTFVTCSWNAETLCGNGETLERDPVQRCR